MTAFELMDRMTVQELRLWVERDATYISKTDYIVAALLAKLDWIKGVKSPDPTRYLKQPKAGKRRGSKTLGQIRAMFWSVAAASGGLIKGAIHGGRPEDNQPDLGPDRL
jgi:hypothetical protein